MCSKPFTPVPVDPRSYENEPSSLRSRFSPKFKSSFGERKSIESQSADPEKNFSEHSSSPMLDLSFYKIINNVWHYCSVDWGSKCRRIDH